MKKANNVENKQSKSNSKQATKSCGSSKSTKNCK